MKAQAWRFPALVEGLGDYTTLDGIQSITDPYYERFRHFDSLAKVEKDYIIAEYNIMKKSLSAIGSLTDIEDAVRIEIKKNKRKNSAKIV